MLKMIYIVDGTNPAPVAVGSLSHYLLAFMAILGGFLNHQQF